MQHGKVMIPKADSNTVCRMYVMLPMTDDGRFYHVLNVLFIFRVFIVCIKFLDVRFYICPSCVIQNSLQLERFSDDRSERCGRWQWRITIFRALGRDQLRA